MQKSELCKKEVCEHRAAQGQIVLTQVGKGVCWRLGDGISKSEALFIIGRVYTAMLLEEGKAVLAEGKKVLAETKQYLQDSAS